MLKMLENAEQQLKLWLPRDSIWGPLQERPVEEPARKGGLEEGVVHAQEGFQGQRAGEVCLGVQGGTEEVGLEGLRPHWQLPDISCFVLLFVFACVVMCVFIMCVLLVFY